MLRGMSNLTPQKGALHLSLFLKVKHDSDYVVLLPEPQSVLTSLFPKAWVVPVSFFCLSCHIFLKENPIDKRLWVPKAGEVCSSF